MATLHIDADACPVVREAIRLARAAGFRVVVVGNTAQNLARFAERAGVEVVTVGIGPDAADFEITRTVEPGDVVVTQDIGLAAMVLGRGVPAISPRGRIFSSVTIDAEMAVRHAEARHRRAGGRTGGPRPFTDEDREHFEDSLSRVLSASSRGDDPLR